MTIHYIQPFALDKNIGKAYNEACALIPADDWICITDHDVMFLEPTTKNLIAHNVEKYRDKYRLFTCMTNRLAIGHQLHNNQRSDDPDIRNHMEIARERRQTIGDLVSPYRHDVAGFFLLFSTKTWAANPFKERSIYFDTIFATSVRRNNGRVGLMEGVYVFHLYRFGQPDPEHKANHLI